MAELDNTLNQMDPDAGDYFGVPSSPEQSQLVLVSVPWDATAPAGAVASYAPDAIIEVSARMDPYDPISPDEWKNGFATDDVDYTLQDRSQLLRSDVEKLRSYAASGGSIMGQLADDYYARRQRRVDDGCRDMVASVRAVSAGWLRQGKVVGLVGGDHSTPQGLIEALAAREPGIGILHMDARCRLKARCEGFEYSCESLMYNVLKNVEGIGRVVQVSQRDFSATEHRVARESERIALYDTDRLASMRFDGASWREVCDAIVSELPSTVYVDFDISALSIENCPHSPYAAPGGLRFDEALYMINRVVESGRRIAGFDVAGVVPKVEDYVDAAVAARMLYRLCGMALRSQKCKS